MVHKGDKLEENALPAHPQFFAQALAGEIVLLRKKINQRRKNSSDGLGKFGEKSKTNNPCNRVYDIELGTV